MSSSGEGTQPGWEGNYGVNRMVWTKAVTGYYAVDGDFSMTFGLPTRADGWTITDLAGARHLNMPSFYLGGRGTQVNGNDVHFDAGMQYSLKKDPASTSDPRPAGTRIGWTCFIRNSRSTDNAGYVSARVWNSTISRMENWNGGHGSPFNSSLEFHIGTNGAVRLTADALGEGNNTFYWNQDTGVGSASSNPGQIYPQAQRSLVDVAEPVALKRTVAMTRRSTPTAYTTEPDGSWLNCTFSDGHLSHRSGATNSRVFWVWEPGSTVAAVANAVDQDATGYDAPGNNAPNLQAWDRRLRTRRGRWQRTPDPNGSRYIVHFPNLGVTSQVARSDTSASYETRYGGTTESRYTHETVHIYLRQAGRARGR